MMHCHAKSWFTAAELAELKLAGLPKSKRKINERADQENWKVATGSHGLPLARPRTGRGGGLEYHVLLLPAAAKADLARRGISFAVPQPGETDVADAHADRLWQWFDRQSEKVKAEAHRRAGIVTKIEMFEASGMTRSAAVAAVAGIEKVSSSTLWNWLRLIDVVPADERLPHLAPRRKGGGKEEEVDPEIWQALISDYLRFSGPSWMTCYRRAEDMAKVAGVTLPHSRTLWRKFEREVPAQVVTLRRKGEDALRRMLPPQIRSVADLHAMELVNIDGHRCDVFVRWPDGRIVRPTMIAIQDVMSRKFLAWRHAETEDMVTARLTFADLFQTWGIPKGLLADNGRAFASKWLTGGAKTRFRFKIRDEDPVGLLTGLGINIHWAKPYRGSSKPIERAFKDFCDAIAKHPAFEGAYTGNNPNAKPENYGSRAVDLDTFLRVWNVGIAAHNRQLGRRTEMAMGRLSFDQVFEASYAAAPIGKATPEQLRLALYAADQVRTDRKTGAVTLAGNRYWVPELAEIAGQLVTVRFDPEDLHQPVHVYSHDGRFLVTAPIWEATGFLDMEAAKARARLEKRWKKAAKEAEAALDLLSAEELVAKLPSHDEDAPIIAPKIIRPVRHRGPTAAALKPVSEAAEEAFKHSVIDRLSAVPGLRLVD
jgi:putative transposase